MKKSIVTKIICILLLITTLLCIFNSCCEASATSDNRMVYIESFDGGSSEIYYDKYTKVMYIISNGSYNRGNATIMVDADGNPLLYDGQ